MACEGLRVGRFFEIANDSESAELFTLDGGLLVSRLPLPEAPYDCREIPGPDFVEEIR